jgi:hypothetical protein
MCNGRDSELELRTLPRPSQAKSTMQCPPTADTAAANLGSANTVHRNDSTLTAHSLTHYIHTNGEI